MQATTIDLETCSLDEIRAEYYRVGQTSNYGQPGYEAMCDQLRAIKAVGVRRFAKPQVPGCSECEEYSVFGGPSHGNSSYCQSGKRPHCTCDWCF